MRLYWIWFAHHPELSDPEKGKLLDYFRDPENIFFARSGDEFPQELEPLVEKARRSLDLAQAESVLERCARDSIEVICYNDKAYPQRLMAIADPPLVLYCKGKLPDVDALAAVGIVGTRSASAYGLNTARKMGYQIARCGGAVVSGMAAGIDAMAMEGALTGGGQVIGVLGCGVDRVYPSCNRKLFEDMGRYGCILSEYMPGTAPLKWNFPKRNRIISGLSCGVLVVEAPEKSGALITANLAAEQGRDVFVVPGNVDVPGFMGSYRLMRDGAIPVGCGWDVMSEYASRFPELKPHSAKEGTPPTPEESTGGEAAAMEEPTISRASGVDCDKKDIDKQAIRPYIDVNKLTEDERTIVSVLSGGEMLVDDLIAESGLSTGKMLAAMTMLELKGLIQRLPGRRAALKNQN